MLPCSSTICSMTPICGGLIWTVVEQDRGQTLHNEWLPCHLDLLVLSLSTISASDSLGGKPPLEVSQTLTGKGRMGPFFYRWLQDIVILPLPALTYSKKVFSHGVRGCQRTSGVQCVTDGFAGEDEKYQHHRERDEGRYSDPGCVQIGLCC